MNVDKDASTPSHGDLPALLQKLGKFLHRAHHLEGHPRHGQRRILAILKEGGSLNQRDLLEDLDIRSSSLSELLAKLTRQGLITRERDEGDRRNYVIRITERGRAAMEDHGAMQSERDALLFAALSESERRDLGNLLQKLLNSWGDIFSRPGMDSGHGGFKGRSFSGRGRHGRDIPHQGKR